MNTLDTEKGYSIEVTFKTTPVVFLPKKTSNVHILLINIIFSFQTCIGANENYHNLYISFVVWLFSNQNSINQNILTLLFK